MPSPTSRARKVEGQPEKIKNRGGKVTERSASFHGKGLVANQGSSLSLRRPKTDPDLLSGMRINKSNGGIFSAPRPETSQDVPKLLTKLLLNVTVQRSLGPIHVVMSPGSTVGDLITMVVKQYSKEGRRPSLSTVNPFDFNLHYSQFSLESLDKEDKLIQLGSRNFFLCPKNKNVDAGFGPATSSSNPCSNQAGSVAKKTVQPPWCRFIDFLTISSSTL